MNTVCMSRTLLAFALVSLTTACGPATPPPTLAPGEDLRIRESPQGEWQEGALASYDSATITLHTAGEDRVFELVEADRIEWYESKNVAEVLLLGVAIGLASVWASDTLFCDDTTHECSSSSGEYALFGVLGLGLGGLELAISPGNWRDATGTFRGAGLQEN